MSLALLCIGAGIGALAFASWRARVEYLAKAAGWEGSILWSVALVALVLRDTTELGTGSQWHVIRAGLSVVGALCLVAGLALRTRDDHRALRRLGEALEALLITGGLFLGTWVVSLGAMIDTSERSVSSKVLLVCSPLVAVFVGVYSLVVALRASDGERLPLISVSIGGVAFVLVEAMLSAERLGSLKSGEPTPIAVGLVVVAYAAFAFSSLSTSTSASASASASASTSVSASASASSSTSTSTSASASSSTMTSISTANSVDRPGGLRLIWWFVPVSALSLAGPSVFDGSADTAILAIISAIIAVHLLHDLVKVVESQQLTETFDSQLSASTSDLAAREVYYRSLFERSTDFVAIIGPDYRFREFSPSLASVLGWRPEELRDIPVDELLTGLGAHDALAAYRRVFDERSRFEAVQDRLLHGDGTWRDVEIQLANYLDDPIVRGVVATTRDVTERRRVENALLNQAFHDPLTGLANRALFRTTLDRSVEIAAAHGHSIAVLLLDLDGFKAVNDSLGHSAGDRVLLIFADRMRGIARVEDTLARLGGDEFAILVEPGVDPATVAKRLEAALSQPVELDGNLLELSASIGIADTRHASSVDDLLRNADVAMYAAKQDPSRSSVRFDPSMHEQSARRIQLLADLRGAIERKEFEAWLQPIVHLSDGSVRGFEALVRWAHPTEGILFPGDFVPLAEESGLIDEIGDMVLRRAVTDAAPALIANGWYLSVNVSTRQLEESKLLFTTQELLRTTGLPPEQLVLEITESAVMTDPETALIRLERLAKIGVRIALDDFGTGYSSLGVLSKFPFKVLKVDRSFVRALHDDAASATALLSAIDEIGRALDLTIVAEGIETEGERTSLLSLGYGLGQGFLFSRAVPAAEALRSAAGSIAMDVALAN